MIKLWNQTKNIYASHKDLLGCRGVKVVFLPAISCCGFTSSNFKLDYKDLGTEHPKYIYNQIITNRSEWAGGIKHLATNNDYLHACFSDVNKMIEDGLSTKNRKDLQYTIEKYLFEAATSYNLKSLGTRDFELSYGKETTLWITSKRERIIEYLNKMVGQYKCDYIIDGYGGGGFEGITQLEPGSIGSAAWGMEKNERLAAMALFVLSVEKVADLLISFFLFLCSEEPKIEDKAGIRSIDCYSRFGKRIGALLIWQYYQEYCTNNKGVNLKFGEWRKETSKLYKYLEDETNRVGMAGYLIQFLGATGVGMATSNVKYGDDLKLHNVIEVDENARRIMNKSGRTVHTIPSRLPMIVEPRPYSLDRQGNVVMAGYLGNNEFTAEELIIKRPGYSTPTKILEENTVLGMINGVSAIPYKIDRETLKYIEMYGVEKGVLTAISSDLLEYRRNPNSIKWDKKSKKAMKALASKSDLETNIINIALVYSKVDKIYFPVRMDQRTRIYCLPDYFHYQGSDLARGLLLFANPGYIKKHDKLAINYFKSYGAILFNGDISKKSHKKRVIWCDENKDRILNFRDNDIIRESSSKASFISFCFEFERFNKFMDDKDLAEFPTYFPIQLDATCNGYQHIALITKERDILGRLNLTKSTLSDDPQDFYSYILIKVIEFIDRKLASNNFHTEDERKMYIRLSKIKLTRGMIKKAMMTYGYNASFPTLLMYLIELMIKEIQYTPDGKTITVYKVDDSDEILYRADLSIFIKCFTTVIKEISPRMEALKNYTRSIVRICTKLNKPVVWIIPSGAMISQSYMKSSILKIRPFSFMKSKYTFRIYEETFAPTKQSNALMPNLIHSLDASSIALLYDTFRKEINHNLYTIHDCFAVTADKVTSLMDILKGVYMKIYSDPAYIIGMHEHIIKDIKATMGEDVFTKDGKYINIGNERILYPTLDKVLDTSTSIECLLDSANFIK